jgi:predicted AlkP superfamily pyrophosphatase or phosphodiesterase
MHPQARPHARQALLFVIDGLRPDALLLTDTPEIDRLIAQSASTMQAQAVMPSVTLPCHVSLFYATPPERHGVTSNTWQAPDPPIPGLIEIVHRAGLGTAALYTWEELRDLARPGSLDIAYYRRLGEPEEDRVLEIGSLAARYIAEHKPGLSFVYLEAPDQAGHRFGWMSDPYLQAVHKCDRAIGVVLEALQEVGDLQDTIIVVTSDHGGHDHRHGADIPEDLLIPWIISGLGVRIGHTIETPISIMDTAPTLLHLLGIPLPGEWTGQIVSEALV